MNFEAFYIKNKNFVYNLALQYVQNIEEAQEITQDVFLKAHQKIHTFKEHHLRTIHPQPFHRV